ncbi:MAG TPA: DUF6788 family protein [Candidatus Methylomirabilis sp.]
MTKRIDIPSLRKRIWASYRSLRPLFFEMLRIQTFLRGSVYELSTRCGKPSCICQRGQRHRRWVLSESLGGRTRLRVVPHSEIERWQRWSGSYRNFRRRRAEFVKITRRILEDLDTIERGQRRSPE